VFRLPTALDVSFVLGLVAFSYGLEACEPSICNRKLAAVIDRIVKSSSEPIRVVAQWEIALALELMGYHNCFIVWPKPDSYLNSDDVVLEAIPILQKAGITDVIPVAQPLLHYPAAAKKLKDGGFKIIDPHMPKIGHNPNSLQPWTRSSHALVRYAIRQKLTGHQGPPIITEQIMRLLNGATN
jgi:hypothetical protein